MLPCRGVTPPNGKRLETTSCFKKLIFSHLRYSAPTHFSSSFPRRGPVPVGKLNRRSAITLISMTSWACSKCTFLNPPTQTSTCQVCLSPSLDPSPKLPSTAATTSSSQLRWSCSACTFSNSFGALACEMCSTLRSHSRISASDEIDVSDVDAITGNSVGSVFLPLRRCSSKRKLSEVQGGDVELKRNRGGDVGKEDSEASTVSKMIPDTLKILSYNVWFHEELEVHKRMEALGSLIEKNSPDFICFQEVTPMIYRIFRNSDWWRKYECSLSPERSLERPYFCMQMSRLPLKQFDCKPFHNSVMGRELCIAQIDNGIDGLVIATSHLESPCPAPPKWDQMYSPERVVQAKESFNLLKDFPNVVFCGDMNWDDKLDGPFPLPEGWVDPWVELRHDENGWTYDTKANAMLSANRKLQKRLDRFSCKFKGFKLVGIEMIGQEPIHGLTYVKEKMVKKQTQKLVLPVIPSDHYGLLMTIRKM